MQSKSNKNIFNVIQSFHKSRKCVLSCDRSKTKAEKKYCIIRCTVEENYNYSTKSGTFTFQLAKRMLFNEINLK